mmetsp:Transcript_89496/g.248546  ORF Transcript_89496/g.248546 Transcript_89496/m.248546 type:complete len:222 (+) Transcript_89496:1257-1922(+)
MAEGSKRGRAAVGGWRHASLQVSTDRGSRRSVRLSPGRRTLHGGLAGPGCGFHSLCDHSEPAVLAGHSPVARSFVVRRCRRCRCDCRVVNTPAPDGPRPWCWPSHTRRSTGGCWSAGSVWPWRSRQRPPPTAALRAEGLPGWRRGAPLSRRRRGCAQGWPSPAGARACLLGRDPAQAGLPARHKLDASRGPYGDARVILLFRLPPLLHLSCVWVMVPTNAF